MPKYHTSIFARITSHVSIWDEIEADSREEANRLMLQRLGAGQYEDRIDEASRDQPWDVEVIDQQDTEEVQGE